MKCYKKRDLDIWKLVAQFHHVSRDNAPLILYGLFCIQVFLIYETAFYSDYYVWFDYLDTFIYLVIGYDVYKQLHDNYIYEKLFTYNETNGICCILLFALLILNLIQSIFGLDHYIGYYKAILLGGAVGLIFTRIK